MTRPKMISFWPGALLSLALLLGICSCFRRLDCMDVFEVKALISILFGLATSCLLLSFIWLVQRKPFNGPWPNQAQFSGELPSMHPRGRLESNDQPSGINQVVISTISNSKLIDDPPCYNDALKCSVNSKLTTNELHTTVEGNRKIPYTTLDANQLMILSGSPPKYHEIYMEKFLCSAQ